MKDMPALGALVTGERNRLEPYHRWLAYKQAFAPQLVREFIRQAEGYDVALPLLDPFSGSGTVAIEAARQGVPACGVEALSVLVFLTRARGLPASEALPPGDDLETLADACGQPAEQARLLLARARQHDSDGRPLRQPAALSRLLEQVQAMIAADLAAEPLGEVSVLQGDARRLDGLADGSCGGLLTSPPYLSRHDYTRIVRPLASLYGRWYPEEVALDEARALQIKAHPLARESRVPAVRHPAVEEVIANLRAREVPRMARIVHEYFADMKQALQAAARVLAPGAPAWIVIGGARLAEIYIPADLILLELAEKCGFAVRRVCRARDLHRGGRQLGGLTGVAPRETLLMLRREA